jgi:hypothetical protein
LGDFIISLLFGVKFRFLTSLEDDDMGDFVVRTCLGVKSRFPTSLELLFGFNNEEGDDTVIFLVVEFGVLTLISVASFIKFSLSNLLNSRLSSIFF